MGSSIHDLRNSIKSIMLTQLTRQAVRHKRLALSSSQSQACQSLRRQLHPINLPPHLRHDRARSWFRASQRNVSTTATRSSAPYPRTRFFLYTTATAIILSASYLYFTDARSSVHQYLTPRIIRSLYPDAEDAHHFGTQSLSTLFNIGLHPRERSFSDAKGDLSVEVFGHRLANPIGISAGLDKNAQIPTPLFALGPAVVEVGGTTPLPQEGNPKPRVFRVTSQDAMINRYGLNSEGADAMARRLRQRVREFAYGKGYGVDEAAEKKVLDGHAGVPPGSLAEGRLLAVQVAKNKSTPEGDINAVKRDYVSCVDRLAPYADIIVVNVSSPNTPGLRSLQRVEPLTSLLRVVVDAAQATKRKTKPKVMVKVSPDEDSDEQVKGIIEAVFKSGVDGVVVGNTTNRRPVSTDAADRKTLNEQGGYSGPWLFDQTKSLVGRYRRGLDAYHSSNQRSEASEPQSSITSSSTSSPPAGTAPPKDSGPIEMELAKETPTDDDLKLASQSTGRTQPTFRLPDRHNPFSSSTSSEEEKASLPTPKDLLPSSLAPSSSPPASSSSSPPTFTPSPSPKNPRLIPSERKVIFASGGITSGAQAQEVLDAGADVAMVYTALTYGGVGLVGRIKEELRAARETVKKV